jgi:hypothetical protein
VSNLRAAATLAMLFPRRAAMRSRSVRSLVPHGWRWMASTAHRAHQFRALFGDVAAVHNGVGFVMAWGQPGPRAQRRRAFEAGDVANLGYKHGGQSGSDAVDGLDCPPAAVAGQLLGDGGMENLDLVVVDVDQLNQ